MIWSVPKIWQDGDVWILGGGPSVIQQFNIPQDVVQKVLNKELPLSAYSEYLAFLHDKHVIGINVAYQIGNWIDLVFFGDQSFFFNHLKGLSEFEGLKCSSHHCVEQYPWVKYLPRNNSKNRGISENPKSVCWNGNSGSAAISIAANAGAKRIFLLGFDMKLDDANKQHFHNQYDRLNKVRNPKKPFELPFNRHLIGFHQISIDARLRGIEIINVCPDSAITQFRKVSLKDIT